MLTKAFHFIITAAFIVFSHALTAMPVVGSTASGSFLKAVTSDR
ncbi:MAG: hypothetical protein QOH63_3398 [Acidobacteriota bacterium]|nr:hypothetical protein [Acidobacteriota bacterium]